VLDLIYNVSQLGILHDSWLVSEFIQRVNQKGDNTMKNFTTFSLRSVRNRGTVRSLTSTKGGTAGTNSAVTPKSIAKFPNWGAIGLGVSLAGFYGLFNETHKIRRDLQELKQGQEELKLYNLMLYEDMKEVKRDVKSIT